MTAILFPLLGAALLLLLGFDILITVFHPEGRGGPLNREQSSIVWRLFRAVGREKDGEPGLTLLSFAGPVLAVLTIVTWAVVLILAFALIYFPAIETFPVLAGAEDPAWLKAIYFSGHTASTVGIGDVAAPGGVYRLLAVAEALGGFALFTMSVTYVLAVYRELGMATALAMNIAGYFGEGRRHPAEVAGREPSDPFNDWVDRTTRVLLRVTQAHSQYPIIHYFHASARRHTLLLQLAPLIELIEHAERPAAGSAEPAVARRPSLDALRLAVAAHLDEVSETVVPGDFEPDLREGGSLKERHERLLRYMIYPVPGER